MIFKRASFVGTSFTTIPNTLLRGGGDSASSAREDGLTPEALGVLVYLLSHVAEWQVSQSQLCMVFAVGKTKMQSITKCLEQSGYVKRAPARVAGGQFGGYDYLVSDSRDFSTEADYPSTVKPSTGKPSTDNPPQRITIDKKYNNKEKLSWKEQLCTAIPSGVPKHSWLAWWEHKQKNNRAPSSVAVTRQTKDFEIMVKAGFDIGELVSYAIARGTWQRIGDPDWTSLAQFKNKKRNDDLLGAIK